jgi:hypothetical protein
MSPKVKTMKGEGVGHATLARSTSRVEGRIRAPGLRRLTSKSITHVDMYKPNNKLINA